ncbi:MAG: NAD-dependent epimerase/dehydratase family protein [Candidatus Marinimicrobia bacterium]|nr:NAD-dependent epimerase/dehydratase family protein [Candidatus Neomarinimicrobiota bacterium]MBL7023138.1 NAD-dependent epimerase/dehydratase family protein [Candidatus Neomarinimicrobiota bacterium]MBL7109054.1 NAD-dependent epimerase/dehydratase family protein [Candidatus Neomarinimicrobiota bacterium]
MRKKVILITGANGEMGRGLIADLYRNGTSSIIAMDLQTLDASISNKVMEPIIGNVLDKSLMEQINGEYEISAIYHLAALLSTRAEFSPQSAHDVNVGGTLNLLTLAVEQGRSQGKAIPFFFPSSIAVYGLPDLETKKTAGAITEAQFCTPETMYGCNKIYAELLGAYFEKNYQRLAAQNLSGFVDFRSIRFPGIISAMTIPTGGTSDFAPEMLHSAAKGENYNCFVRDDTQIPFMTMPDAIDAISHLMRANKENLTQSVYNIRAFAPTATELREKTLSFFPDAIIGTEISEKRQAIVDSWPADCDDSSAKTDWNWNPKHDFEKAFNTYLIPNITAIYNV